MSSRRAANNSIPIIIDNGSYQCRIGLANSAEPQCIFKSLIAKPRKERGKKDGDPPVTPPIQIGNDIANIETVRFQLKTQFDRNVVTNFEAQEQIFDYSFNQIGINVKNNISHPIVLTEPFVNPSYCRRLMSELLFETYSVPSLSYGVDGLFSFYENNVGNTGLLINCGYHSAHIIPILKGNVITQHSKRINLGGFQIITYLHRLLQLKYPVHINAITISRVEEILTEHGHIALDYQDELKKWVDSIYYNENVKKIQLPYTQPAVTNNLSAEAQKERKKEMAKRLIEINARKREEKLAEDEEQLNQLLTLQDLLDDGEDEEFHNTIQTYGIKNEDDLQKQINQLHMKIEKTKQKIALAATGENEFINVDDKNLPGCSNKIQPPTNPKQFSEWIQEYKKKRSDILATRLARKQRKLDMAKRKTVAAQERMRIISHLAKKEKEGKSDDFGMRDEDWDVYKTISKEGNDSDSEAENEKLIEIDEILREYDPEFVVLGNESTVLGISEAHQLHVGIEKLRAPELLFQPFMMGNIEAGLAETIEYVLKKFSPEDQLQLANNVFLTGGCANFKGLKERLSRELLEMRPFQTPHKITMANNPTLDAWKGAQSFANKEGVEKYFITKKEYEELGSEYFKEHYCSNKYFKKYGHSLVSHSSTVKDEKMEY